MEFDGFDWDHGNRDKCRKHGVSIAEIESLFDGTVFVGPDAAHSASEQRFRAKPRLRGADGCSSRSHGVSRTAVA
jgi:uncharacterized protein